MQYTQDGNTYIIYVQQNEKIMDTLTQFGKDHDIHNGQISGIGAIKNIAIAGIIQPVVLLTIIKVKTTAIPANIRSRKIVTSFRLCKASSKNII